MLEGYSKLNTGVIKQNIVKPYKYDVTYVDDRYNKYGELGKRMSYLRYGYIVGTIGYVPHSILDVGYGNGDFLSICSESVDKCYGNDVSNYVLPENINFVEDIKSYFFDVITFFDSLEHFESIDFVKELSCNYICISVPWCHYDNDDWFFDWKHRREDEHIFHFSEKSLINFMSDMGFIHINTCNLEDIIRKPNNKQPNILTGVFKNIKEK